MSDDDLRAILRKHELGSVAWYDLEADLRAYIERELQAYGERVREACIAEINKPYPRSAPAVWNLDAARIRAMPLPPTGGTPKDCPGCARLRSAIERVLADDESQPGGWGPDVTMQGVLRAALEPPTGETP